MTSVAEARVAAELGASSVEVCTWLACGGVTPSSGLVDAIRSVVRTPVRVLIRPTPAGFSYNADEIAVLLTDVEIFGAGAMGLVTGALDETLDLHLPFMAAVREKAPESEITFHRAIDQAKEPLRVLERCLDAGVDRVLTSGATITALDGASMIADMVRLAGDRCAIAAAGGVGPENVVELVERTGVQEVHFSAQRSTQGNSLKFALGSDPITAGVGGTDRAKIEGVLNALVKAGLR